MKVLKKSRLPQKLRIICDGFLFNGLNETRGTVPCGAKLEIQASDIFNANLKSPQLARLDFVPAIKCPICGSLTYVDISNMSINRNAAAQRGEEDVQ